MFKIKNFSTKNKNEMLDKIIKSGAKIKMPFKADEILVTKKPYGLDELVAYDESIIKIR
jgi:hypothetical protein